MRILIVTETFLPKIDGVTNTICHLLDHLALRGHHSLMIAPKGGPSRYAKTPIIGLDAFPFPLYPELKLVPPVVAGLESTGIRFQPDLIHVINPISLGLVGLQMAKSLSIPVVASYHTDLPGFADRWGVGFFERTAVELYPVDPQPGRFESLPIPLHNERVANPKFPSS